MLFITKYLNPLEHCEEILIRFCLILKVEITSTSLKKDLSEHPNYPSLVAVGDILNNYGIENLAIKTGMDAFAEYPTPFIVQVRVASVHYPLFGIVTKVENDNIEWYNSEKHKTEIISAESFSKIFTGYILFAEAEEKVSEKDYKEKIKEEKQKTIKKEIIAWAIPVITLIFGIFTIIQNGVSGILPTVFTLLTLAGSITGLLLLLYEVDQYNPSLQQICHAGKKTNCAAILNSKDAKIFGISWASIGSTYFMGMLFALLIGGIVNPQFLFIAFWLNVLALAYVPYSLFYQWRVAKEWCPLCLTVQAVLVLQFITGLAGRFYHLSSFNNIGTGAFFTFLILFAIVFLAVELLIPALEKAKQSKNDKLALKRIKHNPQIFDALLSRQKQITESTDGLGITIGNPNAKHKLIKVCNPFCGPCAKAHPMIEDLLHNNEDIQLQMIFTVSEEADDYRAKPVRHLLAIDELGNKENTKKALDDWYLADVKDYDAFAEKYSMNGELEEQTDKIKAMREWCDKTEIAFTPTFFINGHQLPEMYSVSDLKYFLSV